MHVNLISCSLIHCSEFLAEVDEILFWNFIQRISNIEEFESLSDKGIL